MADPLLHKQERRQETLHVGPEAIASFISRLPKTSHPMTDSAKFVVDSWQQHGTGEVFPDLLVIIVHGEFAERKLVTITNKSPLSTLTVSQTHQWPVDPLIERLSWRRHHPDQRASFCFNSTEERQ